MNTFEKLAALKSEWTDQFVTIKQDALRWQRFAGIIGKVVTINGNLQCLVDFQDGAWYDIAPDELQRCVDQEAARGQYNPRKNSAQRIPVRQS